MVGHKLAKDGDVYGTDTTTPLGDVSDASTINPYKYDTSPALPAKAVS
jgi:hypothetical protein